MAWSEVMVYKKKVSIVKRLYALGVEADVKRPLKDLELLYIKVRGGKPNCNVDQSNRREL